MHSFCKTIVRGAVLCGILAALLGYAGQASSSTQKKAEVKTAPNPEEFVGSETCLTQGCHADRAAAIKAGPHARAFNPNAPSFVQGCESCHGPGKNHVSTMDKTKIKTAASMMPSEYSATCTECHDRMRYSLWAGSQHETRNVGCANCHSIHSPKSKTANLKAGSESELCAQCHRPQVNKTNRFSHMPVREDKMACSSCHNTHGTSNVSLLRVGTSVDESCTSCHAEKRGPFLWEHAPVADTCTTCHDSHGSNNPQMLVAKQPFLCQRCHVTSRHPPTVYEGYTLQTSQNANKIYGRSCVVCHQMVHGSNSPNGKMYLR
jgi:DmsE family decaheme c-type cytochrome